MHVSHDRAVKLRSPLRYVLLVHLLSLFFFFNDPSTTEIYTLSLHDALPISTPTTGRCHAGPSGSSSRTSAWTRASAAGSRSEEHTSELQSLRHLVCRLLLEKKKKPKEYTRSERFDRAANHSSHC